MGMAVNVWTVNAETDSLKRLEAGADALTDDYPDRRIKIRDELANTNSSREG